MLYCKVSADNYKYLKYKTSEQILSEPKSKMDNLEEILALNNTLIIGLLNSLKNKNKRKRPSCHVRQYPKERKLKGRFESDFDSLASDQSKFYENFHMTPKGFENIFSKIVTHLLPKKDTRKDSISPKEKFAMVIEFLASGDLQRHICSCYRISKQHGTAGTQNVNRFAKEFEAKCNLPNCVLAIDGKHVPVKAPANSGTLFYNFKGFYSIVIMAACSANCKFTYLDIGAFGSEGDANIFRKSEFGADIITNRFNFPDDKSIAGTRFPLYLVADDAFPLCKRIMKPYGGKNVTREERIFKYRLSRARICIEQTFGILSAKWLCLRRTLLCNPSRAQKIVTACCLLHNFLMDRDINECNSNNFSEQSQENRLRSVSGSGGRATDYAKNLREWLKDYVNSSSGRVSWQERSTFVN